MTDRQRNGFVLLLVAGLILASLVVIAGIPGTTKPQKTRLGLDLKGGVELVYQGQPTAQTPKVTPDALSRAVDIMRQRVDQLGVSEPEIQTTGGNQITVGLPNVSNTARAEKLVGTTARLAFYDWEANALTPDGKTVASQLQVQNPDAQAISQGTSQPPGNPGSGSMHLYDAVKLASKQTPEPAPDNARNGPLYFMFGKPGSAACAAAAKAANEPVTVGQRCLLSGPNDTKQDLLQGLPTGVTRIRRRDPGRAPRDHRAPGRPEQLHPPASASATQTPSSSCSRITSRCSATTSPTRSRAPTRPATPTSRSVSPATARTPSRGSPATSRTVASSTARWETNRTSTSRSRLTRS